jgi:hypothetical protein
MISTTSDEAGLVNQVVAAVGAWREIVSEAVTGRCAGGAIHHESGSASALGAADWLCLAAAPTFAFMALLSGVSASGPPEMLCSAASPLSGMTPMYLLMSAFHSAPWLKLISRRRGGARRLMD